MQLIWLAYHKIQSGSLWYSLFLEVGACSLSGCFSLPFFPGLFQEFELKLFISAVLEGHFRIASVPDAYPTCLLDCDKCNQSFMLNICL